MRRLRELPPLYETPYDHTKWPDHLLRVQALRMTLAAMNPVSVGDPACGDGAVSEGFEPRVLNDVFGGDPLEEFLQEPLGVDVLVVTEILEHLKDPASALGLARKSARRLLLSTPEDEEDDRNPEHLWRWGKEDVARLLHEAGFVGRYFPLDFKPLGFIYRFQVWICE